MDNGIIIDVVKVILAAVYGLIIGYNREKLNKPAGLKTICVVTMSACLLVLVARDFGEQGLQRMAAQIVPGVGFIGAGVILSIDGKVRGLTTAATILFAAAVGIACSTERGMVLAGLTIVVYLSIVKIFSHHYNHEDF